MKRSRLASRFGTTTWIGAALTSACAVAACTGTEAPPESLGEARSAVFVNGSFEIGAAGTPPASWTVQPFLNPATGVTIQTPQTRAGLNLAVGGNALTTEINGVNQPDPDLGAGASLRWPRYGSQCARVNFHSSNNFGNGRNVNSLSQTMTIAAGDIDPVDAKVHVRFTVAPVLQNPGHNPNEQPYYFVQLTNVTQNTILYRDFNLSAQAGVPWKTVNGGTANEIDYVDWSLVDIAPGSPALVAGDSVKLEVIGGGCALGGHFGEVYVDGVGTTIPGLFVSGTAPTQANAGTNLAYNLTYKNGSASAETGVVIDFTTPPNTTFQSITPPVGATCVTPAVGTSGTIVCTFAGPVPAGGTGGFIITVNINAGATGQVTCGNYDIKSIQESPLLGSKIITTIGCATDTDCTGGNWCHESAPNACVPKIPNGTLIPTDPPHVGPTLNATCTVAASALVCQSSVCDTADDRCGFLNGDGLCSAANAAVVCRSGACDPDTKCGYAVGDGPCTAANGSTVCRSGACSANLLCEPAGGCNVDADCSGGNWCNEVAHTCTPKLPNATPIPNDPPHVGPTLDGTCTVAAATLVCVSSVCDTTDNDCGFLNGTGPCTLANGGVVCRSAVCDPDLKCGYAVGDGPCTLANGGVVCRSGVCSTNGLCEPAGGCNVDADCTGGNWCNESVHACTPKLTNGTAVPTDAPHTGPTLDGTCTVAASLLVCVSSVCDTADDKCGYANGDGPCTLANGGVVCRSGVCSANGLCVPAGGCNVDADCTGGDWCNETAHMCTPKLPNSTPVPTDVPHTNPTLDGNCTAAAGTLVCVSGVCDTNDDKCGYANGDGPCTLANGATVCRSATCSTNGLCEPAGGCNVDADCTGGDWCNETAHACTPKLPNSTPVPTDVPHTSPTLDGNCTSEAATLVCLSSVCDKGDDKCGYANGSGPCTSADGKTVCRSTICATSGTNTGLCVECLMDGDCSKTPGAKCDTSTNTCNQGCTVDADCTGGNWCNETAHMCTPKLPNGTPVPNDPAHKGPTINGTCTPETGVVVCQSGVCDTKDNACGLADGDGPCAEAEQCRNSRCDTVTKICGPATVCTLDTDCPTGDFCTTDGACTPKLLDGSTCDRAAQCKSDDCKGKVCVDVTPSGSGFCATRMGDGGDDGSIAIFGLMVAMAGIARRGGSRRIKHTG